jgi:DUF971 family protein
MATGRPLTPKHIKAPHGARIFTVTWSDGSQSVLPHNVLRGFCPCATCQGHGGDIKYIPGGDLELRTIERVGNYALSLGWGDGHDSGIYTFEYLRELAKRVVSEGADSMTQTASSTEGVPS